MTTMYSLTWANFNVSSVSLVDDPITSGQMAIESFIQIYEPLLLTLDGRDLSSYVDFFFERSACNKSILSFVDEDAKLDFRDEAIHMKLIPPIGDVMTGESQEDVDERYEREAMKREQEMLKQKAIENQKLRRALRSSASQSTTEPAEAQKKLRELRKSPSEPVLTEKERKQKKILLTAQTSLDNLTKKLEELKLQDPLNLQARSHLEKKIQNTTLLLSKHQGNTV